MVPENMTAFRIVDRETDLQIAVSGSSSDIKLAELKKTARRQVTKTRRMLKDYQKKHPGFFESLTPLPLWEDDPPLIVNMKTAAKIAGVGPMAAVAGAVAQSVGEGLSCEEFLIENGGDLYIKSKSKRRIAVDTGNSPYKNLALIIAPTSGLSICTSSGTRGHSLSFGNADAATIISENAFIADAVATALGNRVRTADDIGEALDWTQSLPGIRGALIIIGDKLGAWGDLELADE